ncbi:hypothetical protein QUF72_19750 [Desulfobacterales bacterium HSG2]|nr:hypothetical protein [Desulfobacterales bacterium HSG2]
MLLGPLAVCDVRAYGGHALDAALLIIDREPAFENSAGRMMRYSLALFVPPWFYLQPLLENKGRSERF